MKHSGLLIQGLPKTTASATPSATMRSASSAVKPPLRKSFVAELGFLIGWPKMAGTSMLAVVGEMWAKREFSTAEDERWVSEVTREGAGELTDQADEVDEANLQLENPARAKRGSRETWSFDRSTALLDEVAELFHSLRGGDTDIAETAGGVQPAPRGDQRSSAYRENSSTHLMPTFSFPKTPITAFKHSKTNLARLSKLPPHSSSRWLALGSKNWARR